MDWGEKMERIWTARGLQKAGKGLGDLGRGRGKEVIGGIETPARM